MANSTAIVPAMKQYASQPAVIERLEKTVKNKELFLNTLYSLANDSYMLKKCSVESIFKAAIMAADMGLSINPTIGEAYVVPYGSEAKYMPGYKGIIQLCINTGLYERINATPVFEDEISNFNPLTNEFAFKEGFSLQSQRFTGGKPIGYYSTFELKNGFKSAFFMTKDQIVDYAKKYSKGYMNDLSKGKANTPWSTDFDGMALKTVLKQLLGKYGPKNAKLERSLSEDPDTQAEAKVLTQPVEAVHVGNENIPDAEVIMDKSPENPGNYDGAQQQQQAGPSY
jgi:recombination protein RecT